MPRMEATLSLMTTKCFLLLVIKIPLELNVKSTRIAAPLLGVVLVRGAFPAVLVSMVVRSSVTIAKTITNALAVAAQRSNAQNLTSAHRNAKGTKSAWVILAAHLVGAVQRMCAKDAKRLVTCAEMIMNASVTRVLKMK